MSFPRIYTPRTIARMRGKLDMEVKDVALLGQYFNAMANLYGVIPLREALRIINKQNKNKFAESDFLAFAEIARHEKHNYYILGDEDLFTCVELPSKPIDRQLIICILLDNFDVYYDVAGHQQGKNYYVPEKNEFLKYACPAYYPETNQTQRLRSFLMGKMKRSRKSADNEIGQYVRAFLAGVPMNDFAKLFLENNRLSVEDTDTLIELASDLHNNSRMWNNCGYTPDELFAMANPVKRFRSVSIGPNARNALTSGDTDIDELRCSLLEIGMLDMELKDGFLKELSKVEKDSAPALSQKTPKVGRNVPCPCGSGKKYKHCCGQ